MNSPDSIPPLRELPPERIAARKHQLLTVIAHENAPSRVGRAVRPHRVIALTGIAAVVAMGILLWPTGDRPGALERAVAAVSNGPVLHVVLREEWGAQLVEIATGKTRTIAGEREIWHDPARGTRDRSTFAGIVQSDVLQRPGTLSAHESAFLSGFLTSYVSAVRRGTAVVLDDDEIGGTKVTWLRISSQDLPDAGDGRKHAWAQEVAVARETGLPVFIRETRDGKPERGTGATILSFETLPRDAVDLTPQPPHGPQGAAMFGTNSVLTETEARALTGGRLLTLGDRFAGLKLAAILRTHYAVGYDRAHRIWRIRSAGPTFVYGTVRAGAAAFDRPHVAVTVFPKRPPIDFGPQDFVPPPGWLLMTGRSYTGGHRGLLVRDGLYVSIDASRAAWVLDAARALEPS